MPSTSTDRRNGLSTSVAVKPPCKVAAIANITLSGEQTVNGVAVTEGDRVLVTAQTSSVDNGIWVVGTATWARAKDFDGANDVVDGTLVLVGTTASASQFWLAYGNTDPILPGTSQITFEQVDYQELALRAALASTASASDGDALMGVLHSGSGSVARTQHDRNEDDMHLSDKGTTADMLTALNRVATDFAAGGQCDIEAGTWTLSDTFTFTGQRLNLNGKGRQVSIVSFAPASAKEALVINEASAGGSNQGSIKNLGFTGGANTQNKTAIRLVNVANWDVGYIGISSGAWLGTSIGIKTEGRQYLHIHDCEIACARPIVIGNNTTYPTISADLSVFERLEVIGTDATKPVIEFEDGTSFSNLTIRNTDCIQGKHGIYWNDTTSSAAGFCLKIADFRTEQGLDSSGYSIYLASTAQVVQNLEIDNALLDSARNGIYLRNCQRVTIRNLTFGTLVSSGATTAIDMTFVAGSRLILENCTMVDPAAAITLTNARLISREYVTGMGTREEWIYDANSAAGSIASNVYHGGLPFSLTSTSTATVCDDTFTGLIFVSTSEDLSAVFEVRGTTHTTRELIDNAGVFSQASGTATSVNIYWDAGSSLYLIQNNRASTVTFSIFRIGTSA